MLRGSNPALAIEKDQPITVSWSFFFSQKIARQKIFSKIRKFFCQRIPLCDTICAKGGSLYEKTSDYNVILREEKHWLKCILAKV